jgi:hypothetical protein
LAKHILENIEKLGHYRELAEWTYNAELEVAAALAP